MQKINIVVADDWMAIYLNDYCVFQDHNISLPDGLSLIGTRHELTMLDVAPHEMKKFGGLPTLFSDIPKEWIENES